MPETLTESINKADEQVNKEQPTVEKSEEKLEVKSSEETQEEIEAETEVEEGDLTPEEQTHALNLFKALKNPSSAKLVIQSMAEQAGIIKGEAQAEEVKETMLDVIKEQLGPDLAFLADKLLPAIEKVVDAKVEEQVKPIKEHQETQAQKQVQSEVDKDLNTLLADTKKYPGAEALLPEMNKLMKKIAPSGDTPALEYFETLYYTAAAKKSTKIVSTTQSDKISRNRTDAPSRIASQGKVTSDNGSVTSPRKLNLTSAIQKAMEDLAEKT